MAVKSTGRKAVRMLGALSTFAALVFALPAQAENWRIVGGTSTAIIGIEADGIRQVGPNRRVWQAIVSKEQAAGSDYFVALSEIDCSGERTRTLQISGYTIDGKVVETVTAPGEWSYVIPGSSGASVLAAVCRNEYPGDGTEAVDSANTFAVIAKVSFGD